MQPILLVELLIQPIKGVHCYRSRSLYRGLRDRVLMPSSSMAEACLQQSKRKLSRLYLLSLFVRISSQCLIGRPLHSRYSTLDSEQRSLQQPLADFKTNIPSIFILDIIQAIMPICNKMDL